MVCRGRGRQSAAQATCVYFRETPGDYDFGLHTAPRRQLIVNLDADVEVSVTGGDPPRVFRAGEVFFVEDTTGTGHSSRAVGGRSRRSVFIGIPDDVLRG